jgi:hypothetical protein
LLEPMLDPVALPVEMPLDFRPFRRITGVVSSVATLGKSQCGTRDEGQGESENQ